MWNFISQSGMATAVIDLTNELSPLLLGLVGLVWLSAAMLTGIALRHHFGEKARLVPRTGVTARDRRKAA